MALDFPNSPAGGDIHSDGTHDWVWDGYKWIDPQRDFSTGGGGGGVVSVTGLPTVPNIAALRAGTASSLGSGVVYVQGYWNAGDDGGGMYVLQTVAFADDGGVYIHDADGRTWGLELNGAPVCVTQYGAVADGTTDCTAACQAADTWSRANGSHPVMFPDGVTIVTQLIVHTGSNWIGVGRANPVAGAVSTTGSKIKQKPGTNGKDVILGANSYANFGLSTPTGEYVDGYTLKNLTIDGSWLDGGNINGSGVVIFGCKPLIRDLFITNCSDYGLYTGWTYADPYPPAMCAGFDAWTMEAHIDMLHIDTCGKHGWFMDGPHDSIACNVHIVDAGRSGNNAWDGLIVQTGGSGLQISGGHIWTRRSTQGSATIRMQYALAAVGVVHASNMQFEGAYVPGSFSSWSTVNNCWFYGAAGGICVAVGGSGNVIHGYCDGPANGFPAAFGVQFFGSAGSVQDNIIDVTSYNTNAGVMNFGSGISGGGNRIRIHGVLGATETYSGTPHANDDIRANIANTAGQGVYSNGYIMAARSQASAIAMSSGSTYTPASVVVPPGTWELWASGGYSAGSGTVTFSAVNTQIGVGSSGGTGSVLDGMQSVLLSLAPINTGASILMSGGHGVVTLYVATTIYLCLTANFTGGGAGGFGSIHAKRLN